MFAPVVSVPARLVFDNWFLLASTPARAFPFFLWASHQIPSLPGRVFNLRTGLINKVINLLLRATRMSR